MFFFISGVSLKLRWHGNKYHVTGTNFFCCNFTKLCFCVRMANLMQQKLCFRVRMANLMQQKLLKQNQLRFLNISFQDGGHEQKHRGSICCPSYEWRRANPKEKTDTNYLDKALDATQKNWWCFPYNIQRIKRTRFWWIQRLLKWMLIILNNWFIF